MVLSRDASPASAQAGTPSGRYIHTAIVQPGLDRMLVFGGGSYSERNDLWELALAGAPTWSQLVFPTQAPLRMGHTAIYDTLRDRMIVFGGGDPARRNDTWVLTLSSGSAWSQLATSGTPPPPISLHSAIYDPVRDRMLVFGGYQDAGYLNDVWALSLSGTPTWTKLSPAGVPPAPRREHSAIYDPVGDRMIIFGGTNGGYFNDVWALNLSGTPTWAPIAAGSGPTARSGQTAIYDPTRHVMWTFAGRGSNGMLNDVWTLALGSSPVWAPVSPAGPLPGARVYHTAVLDRARDRMVVFSGYNGGLPSDTWFLSLGPSPAWYPLGGGPPTTPAPVFAVEPSLPSSIVLGQTLTIAVAVRNDGTASDDGRISVGFPEFVDPADGQWVNSSSGGDAPGFQVYAAGSMLPWAACQTVGAAGYLVAQYVDNNWLASGAETNALSLTVQPRTPGTFTIELHSTLHAAGGSSCDWINAQPSGGAPGFIDQQGWAVHRYTVNVLPAPTAPAPVFISQMSIPSSIQIGQSIQLSFSVRNAGAQSDDGRISVSFPTLTDPGDVQWVTSSSAGDSPGVVKTPAGGPVSGSDCRPVTAAYLVAEYADNDWAWIDTETNTFALQVTPQVLGYFIVDVRSSMLKTGAPCEWANGVPNGGESGYVDQLGFPVKRFRVQVTPTSPPIPGFNNLSIPPVSIFLGEAFEVRATVVNQGWSSDDGRISFGFPSFVDPDDVQWASSTSTGDTPGYVEHPPGSPLGTAACQSMTAGYLVVEYQDNGWESYEVNEAAVTVRPQAVGTFLVEMRSTMHKQGGAACDVVGAVPPFSGDAGVDQQGWAVRRFPVTVLPPLPEPRFTADVTVPTSVVVGQPVAVTVSVRNDGATSDDGRISVSFPALTNPADVTWVSSGSSGDTPGTVITGAGGALTGVDCQPVTASYAVAEYRDDNWTGHGAEVNTFVATVRPQVTGTIDVYVRTSMHKTGSTCELFQALPANGAADIVDQQGFAVKRFVVTVNPSSPTTISFDQGGPVFPEAIVLGESFTLSQAATVRGGTSDDGRIVFSFPAFTQLGDAEWVTSASTGDSPGYVERPAGSSLVRAGCEPGTASYLVAEYIDDGWGGSAPETNTLTLSVRPQAIGPFFFFGRVTNHEAGYGCLYANTVPPGGEDGFVDQQGHVVRRYTVTVARERRVGPVFVDPVETLPASVPLGQAFTLTAAVRNDGFAGNGGIYLGFPQLTGPNSQAAVAIKSVLGHGESCGTEGPNTVTTDAQCQHLVATHANAGFYDTDWRPGETNAVSLTITPPDPGPFHVDVFAVLQDTNQGCDLVTELPSNGVGGYTDERGFPVKRFTVQVIAPTGVTPEGSAAFALVGAEPNPTRGPLTVSFSLTGSEPATLELFDLHGRLVARRDVGSLGMGQHRLALTNGRELPVGVYLVRLTRGDQTLDAKACVLK